MRTLLLAALIALLATPTFAHDYRSYSRPRTYAERSYSIPRYQQRYYSSYDRPSSYRWQSDRGYYGSSYRPRFHRHYRDGASSASKQMPGRRWR